MGGENEIMKGSMEEAVAELVLERWGRICLCRDRGKGLLVGGNGMSLFIFQKRIMEGLLWARC